MRHSFAKNEIVDVVGREWQLLASTVLPKKIVRAKFRIVAASAHATHIGLREIIAFEEQGFA